MSGIATYPDLRARLRAGHEDAVNSAGDVTMRWKALSSHRHGR
jgi:hypothetical protein